MDVLEDVSYDTPFVGRENFLAQLHDAWKRHKIFGIFGIRSVGKSRTVLEFMRRITDELKEKITSDGKVVTIDVKMRTVLSTGGLYSQLCSSLGVVPQTARNMDDYDWKSHIISVISGQPSNIFLILFDNAEDAIEGPLRDALLSLCVLLVRNCKNARTFITSTTKAQFSQIRPAYYSVELRPMNYTEGSTLLKMTAPDVDFGDHMNAILTLCEGLPLLILMVGSELCEDYGLIEPKDMVQFLTEGRLRALSREFYPEEDRVADVYKKFIGRLSDVFQRRLSILGYIPGSFSAEQASEILGHDTVPHAKDQTLIPIIRRNMLKYDPSVKRFNIQGILRECLSVYYVIRNVPEVRTRFCRIFAGTMQNIAMGLGSMEYARALAQFSLEQPNLQKLLSEVILTKEDTYPFFIQIATTCTHLIERFLTDESEKFYDGCLKIAGDYGNDDDMATVHVARGSLHTNAKGDFTSGEQCYRTALSLIQAGTKSVLLANVHQRLGWNMYEQGRNEEALRHLEQSLEIQTAIGLENSDRCLPTLTSLGLVNTVLGRLQEAKRYHFAVLQKREDRLGKHHPTVGSVLNNIGILYDQMGDNKMALQFFERGLAIKLKNKASNFSIAFSLNNTANQYCSLKEFQKAEDLLHQSLEELKTSSKPHLGAVSLTYDTMGKVYLAQGKYGDAERVLKQAVDIRHNIMPTGVAYVESLTHLAIAENNLQKYSSAVITTKKVLNLEKETVKAMPQNTLILESMECQANALKSRNERNCKIENDKNSTKWTKVKRSKLLNRIEKELLRLRDIFVCNCNEVKLVEMEDKLKRLRHQMEEEEAEGEESVAGS